MYGTFIQVICLWKISIFNVLLEPRDSHQHINQLLKDCHWLTVCGSATSFIARPWDRAQICLFKTFLRNTTVFITYTGSMSNGLSHNITVFITPMVFKGLIFCFVVIVNGLDFERLHLKPFGYPNDLICQSYVDGLLRGRLECATKCLRSQCIALTWVTLKSTCVVCGRCVSDGDTLPLNATNVYRSLQVITQGKLITENYNAIGREF